MPNIDIIFLPINFYHKKDLAEKMTKALVEELSCAPDDVLIRFHEVDHKSYAAGGKLQDVFSGAVSPAVPFQMNVELPEAKTRGQQGKLASRLTDIVRGMLPRTHSSDTMRDAAKGNVEIRFSKLDARNVFKNVKKIEPPKPKQG